MTKSVARRLAKYDAKAVGDVVKNRIDAQRGDMVSNYGSSLNEQARIENDTKTVLNATGVPPYMIPPYIAFAKRVGKISTTHSGATATTEVCIEFAKGVSRLLDGSILNQICIDVFTIDISACT